MNKYKIYQIKEANKSVISYRLPSSRKVVDFRNVTFALSYSEGVLTYETDDDEIQTIIESLKDYKAGVIKIQKEIEVENGETHERANGGSANAQTPEGNIQPDPSAPKEPTVITEPTNPQQVREILMKEPYKVTHQSLNNPENIRKHATAANLVFPNVVWE